MIKLILSHLSFILPIFICLYIFGLRVEKEKHFLVIFISCFLFIVTLMTITMEPTINYFSGIGLDKISLISIRLCFAFLVYLLSFITCFLSYKVDFFICLFLVTCSYISQHMSRIVVNIIALYFEIPYWLDFLLCLTSWILIYPLIFYIFVYRLKNKELSVSNKWQLIIATIPILFCIVLNSYGGVAIDSTFGNLILDIFILCTTVLGMFLEYLMTLGKDMELEKAQISRMLKEQKEQYLFEKQLIDLVNIKAHDLKHQMNDNQSISKEYLENTKKIIGDYDASFSTGVPSIDIILTKKSRECQRHNIELTCMVDAKCLSFVEEIDIYSLFGNIIDNAIEASRKIENKQRRVITLSVSHNNCFIMIHESNYFDGNINIKNGIPQTSKGNTDYHGYGIKSIKSICEKYEGNLKINAEKGIYNLDILIPMVNKIID